MNTALQNQTEIDTGVLLGALGYAAAISCYSWRNEAWLEYSNAGIELSRTPQERQGFELPAALATGRLGRHEEADALLEKIIAESEDPGMRASALLGQALFETPKRAWLLSQQAMDLSPLDSFGWWDEPNAAAIVGIAAREVGQYDLAAEMLERSLNVGRQWGYPGFGAFAAADLTLVHLAKGRFDEASIAIGEAVPVVRRFIGPNVNTSRVLSGAAETARLQGNLERAHQYVDEAKQATERNHEPIWGLWVTCQEALIARDEGDLDPARKLLDGIVRRAEELGREDFLVWIRAPQASVELRQGRPEPALEYLRGGLVEPDRLSHLEIVEAVDLAAIGFAQQGKRQPAARLWGAVDQERQQSGLMIQPPDRPLREEAVRHARAMFDDGWEPAYRQGAAMTLDQALDYVQCLIERTTEVAPETNRVD